MPNTVGGMIEKQNNEFSLLVWSQEIEYQNLRFPVDLSNPFAVATVLNQEPGKLKIKELREGNQLIYHKSAPGQNMKEVLLVTFTTYEPQQNSVSLLLCFAIRNVPFP